MLTTLHALIFGWLGAITMFILTVSPTVSLCSMDLRPVHS